MTNEDDLNQILPEAGGGSEESLAARVASRLVKAGVISSTSEQAALAALEDGTATSANWKGWIERGQYEQGRQEAESHESNA